MSPKLSRLPALLGCLALILCPLLSTLIPTSLSEHDFARALQLPILLASALLLTASRPDPIQPDRWTWGMFGALFLLVSFSAVIAAVPMAAWREVALFVSLSGWALMIARASQGEKGEVWFTSVGISQLLYGVTYVGLIVAALANQQPILLWEMNLGYDNPRFLNHVQAATLPLLLGMAARPGAGRAIVVMAVVALTLQLFLLAATLGRSTMLGLAVAAFVILLVLRRAANRWLAIGIVATTLAGSAYLGVQSGVGRLQQTVGYAPTVKELTSDHSREYLWGIALADARHAPWLGVGPMHYAHKVNAKGAHPHNLYLQIAAEIGLPALAILVAMILRGLWAMTRALRAEVDPDRQALGAGLLGSGVAIAVDACFSGNLVMPLSQIWIFAIVGLSLGWYRGRLQAASPPLPSSVGVSRPTWLVIRIAFVLASLYLCVSSIEEVRAPTPHLQVEGGAATSPHEASRPRFWSYGWF